MVFGSAAKICKAVTDQLTSKKKRKLHAGMFRPGQSGNPKGRPRAGTALAERIRERLDPDVILDLAARLANDESIPVDKRLAALISLAQMGFNKPPQEHKLEAIAAPRFDLSHLSPAEKQAELARVRALLNPPPKALLTSSNSDGLDD